MKKYDVIIIGGGAAGLACAAMLKLFSNSKKIVVLEALDRVGKKLAVTGNGQCNITNKNLDISSYHGNDVKFAENVFKQFGFTESADFFSSIGVEFAEGENSKIYPYSYQATSVVDALRLFLDENGVEVFCNTTVLDVKKENNGFTVQTNQNDFFSEKVVFATGLLAGGEKLGSTGLGFNILKNLGFKTVKTTPAIVQVRTDNRLTRQLKGVKADAVATLFLNGKKQVSFSGEVLFTDYGLSGPPILLLSSYAFRGNEKAEIALDFMPDYTYNDLYDLLSYRYKAFGNRNAEYFFSGVLHNRLARVLIKECGIALSSPINTNSEKTVLKIAEQIKKCRFSVTGHNGMNNAQVTSGGISTDEFNPDTMESKRIKGLYAVGELLDIDGNCGGFNLAFAWGSAYCAAKAIGGEE